MRYNMKGWNFAEFVKGNKDLLKYVAGALVALQASGSLSPGWSLVVGLGAKGVLDLVHYFVVE